MVLERLCGSVIFLPHSSIQVCFFCLSLRGGRNFHSHNLILRRGERSCLLLERYGKIFLPLHRNRTEE